MATKHTAFLVVLKELAFLSKAFWYDFDFRNGWVGDPRWNFQDQKLLDKILDAQFFLYVFKEPAEFWFITISILFKEVADIFWNWSPCPKEDLYLPTDSLYFFVKLRNIVHWKRMHYGKGQCSMHHYYELSLNPEYKKYIGKYWLKLKAGRDHTAGAQWTPKRYLGGIIFF